jgi:hypothetical protein
MEKFPIVVAADDQRQLRGNSLRVVSCLGKAACPLHNRS